MGSYITQYYNNVIVAFNKNSKYIQINPGEIAVYNNGVETSKKRAAFNENGNHFWRDGYYVGKIGANSLHSDNSKKGFDFDLEWPGGVYDLGGTGLLRSRHLYDEMDVCAEKKQRMGRLYIWTPSRWVRHRYAQLDVEKRFF